MRRQALGAPSSIGPTVTTAIPFFLASRARWRCLLAPVGPDSIVMVRTFPAVYVVLTRRRAAYVCAVIQWYKGVLRCLVALVTARNQLVASLAPPLGEKEPVSAGAGAISVDLHIWCAAVTFAGAVVLNLEERTRALCAFSRALALAASFEILPTLCASLSVFIVSVFTLRASRTLCAGSLDTARQVTTG